VIWKRTRHSHRRRQGPEQRATKQADLDMLEMAAAAGDIDLLHLDESGCCQWSPVSYSYYFRGEQKRQEQTQKRGRRLSILGLWQPFVTFIYGLVFGSMKSENYIAICIPRNRLKSNQSFLLCLILVIAHANSSRHLDSRL
jgi:putative transposase